MVLCNCIDNLFEIEPSAIFFISYFMSVFTTIVYEIFLCLVQTIFFNISIYVSVYLFVFIACSYLIELQVKLSEL